MTVSIVIVTYTRMDLLDACLASLGPARQRLGELSELIVVDNGSPADVAEVVKAHDPEATVVRLEQNAGFSGAVGHGIDATAGEWVALFNDDTTAEPAALAELLAAARSRPRIGSVAAQLRFASDPETINSAGIVIDRLGITSDRLVGAPIGESETEPVEVFGTAGTAALYGREMLEQTGGFDRTFYAHLEDADLAWRARMLGWSCVYAPAAVVYHHHAATLSHFSDEKYYVGGRNRIRLLAKNADRRLLRRYSVPMVIYDAGYVAFVAVRERTLAPLRGRIAGIRDWRRYRRAASAGRRPVALQPAGGIRGALRRRAVWSRSTAAANPEPEPPASIRQRV
jgi:GT2 family glycosyltransferase